LLGYHLNTEAVKKRFGKDSKDLVLIQGLCAFVSSIWKGYSKISYGPASQDSTPVINRLGPPSNELSSVSISSAEYELGKSSTIKPAAEPLEVVLTFEDGSQCALYSVQGAILCVFASEIIPAGLLKKQVKHGLIQI
jgi:hypothetical protein